MLALPVLTIVRTSAAMTQQGETTVGRIAKWATYVEHYLVDLCAKLINEGNVGVGTF